MRDLGTAVFTADDQRRFAELSGDRNPMHLDPLVARRLLAGREVVHGVHVLMTALERWLDTSESAPTAIACSFESAITIGEAVNFLQYVDAKNRVVIDAVANNVVCARTILTCPAPTQVTVAEIANDGNLHRVAHLTDPLDEAPESYLGRHYEVALGTPKSDEIFPNLHRSIGTSQLAAIMTISYFVGMVCPGLHSLLSSLKIEFGHDVPAVRGMKFSVKKYHSNVRLFDLAFEGPIRGRVQAFRRLPPQEQPSVVEVAAQMMPDEFAGTRALVIGGSRGLGELTAKIIAAGGGDVVLTYRSGRDDAHRVRDEINARGGGRCEAARFDVMTDQYDPLLVGPHHPDTVFFFPTPRIFRKGAGVFDADWFAEFSEIYIRKFFALCAGLERMAVKRVRVFFPSSIAVTERPKGLTEYAMAKAAAEILIADINRSFTHVSVVCERLPRLSTDQTVSILDVAAASNLDTLLPIVRSLYR